MKRLLGLILAILVAVPVHAGPGCRESDLIGIGVHDQHARALGCDRVELKDENVCQGNTACGSMGTGAGNVCIGDSACTAVTTGDENIFIGEDAGDAITTGSNCIGIGDGAVGTATACGAGNIFIGDGAGDLGVATGTGNVSVGLDSMVDLTTGTENVAVGDAAGANLTTGDDNICIGEDACLALDTGDDSICIGEDACTAHTGTGSVIVIGSAAGDAMANAGDGAIIIGEGAGSTGVFTGVDNVCVGATACDDFSTATENVCIGDGACGNATTSDSSVAIGSGALGTATTTGNENIAIGRNALTAATSDAQNIAIGAYAGDAIVGGGNSNVLVGNNAGSALTTGDGNVCIGEDACTENTTQGAGIYIGFEAGKSALTPTADRLVVSNSDDATPLMDGILTAGSESLTLNVPRNLTLAGNGSLIQTLTATDNDAQNNTLTVAEICGGITVHTSVTGGGTVTTDTAANIIAGSSNACVLGADNECYSHWYINDGNQTLTFAGGTDVTVSDTGQTLAENEAAVLLFCRTGGTTVTMYVVGG